jgi:uncharacterized protein
MNRIKPIIWSATFLAAVMPFLTACGTSPPSRYYALNSMTAANSTAIIMQQKDVVIVAVGPVAIPEYLDRLEIVTRDSRNQLTLGDFDLWGGSLESDVNRVLVDNLSILLTRKGIGVVSWRTRAPVSHTISVSMTRFEATGDMVVLTAHWGIVERGRDKVEVARESIITKPLAGKEYADIVGNMSDALADLSREIATEVEKAVDKSKSAQNK